MVKPADVSPDGEQLAPSMETRNTRVVISALPNFGDGEGNGGKGWGILELCKMFSIFDFGESNVRLTLTKYSAA